MPRITFRKYPLEHFWSRKELSDVADWLRDELGWVPEKLEEDAVPAPLPEVRPQVGRPDADVRLEAELEGGRTLVSVEEVERPGRMDDVVGKVGEGAMDKESEAPGVEDVRVTEPRPEGVSHEPELEEGKQHPEMGGPDGEVSVTDEGVVESETMGSRVRRRERAFGSGRGTKGRAVARS